MTSWDGGRDAPDPDCGRPAPIVRCDFHYLRNDRQQPIFIERLGNVGRKASFQAPCNIAVINATADGNRRSYVALQDAVGTRAQSGQQIEAAAIGQSHVADEQIKYLALCGSECAGHTGGTNYYVTVTYQQPLACSRDSVVVLHEQNSQ